MDIRSLFLLNPDITYLNHGSFGACPKPIFDAYQKWQLELEREPVQFITKRSSTALSEAKRPLADCIGCQPDDFVFCTNPTFAVNQIVNSLRLGPDDEVLTTNHEYGAMDRTWRFYARKKGFKYLQQDIPIPILSKEQILDAFWAGLTPRTRVVFISHMTSATALAFPVEDICKRAADLGLISIVDGAHVPGHLPLDLSRMKPDFYTGTLHKWLLAPKGSSFLYVDKKHQKSLDPLIISWGYESETPSGNSFLDQNEMQGTRDISAFLCTPAAMQFRADYEWEQVGQACRNMILHHYPECCNLLGSTPICPLSDAFLGQMCSIPIRTPDPVGLKEALYNNHRIEIPIMKRGADVFMRISIQGYNTERDLDRLKSAIVTLRKQGLILK